MNPVKISIIIPVYNVEKYLKDCLDSVLGQTLQEGLEVIAVNDGSTDGSGHILQEYQKAFPSLLTVYTTENKGVSHARNYGFSKSQGEYIWFIDADDRVEPDACQKLAERILREPYDLILFGYELVFPDPSKNSVQLPGHPEDSFDLSAHPEYLVHCTPYPCDKLIGRSLLSKVSFPEGLRFEDIPAIFPAAASASHAGVIREAFYHYRRNVGFLDRISEGTLDIVPALRLFRKNMEELGLLSRFAPEVEYLVIRHCFHRLRKLLFDNSRDNIPLKLRISNACFDYLEQDYPDWKKNPLLPVYFPDYLKRPWYFYSSRRHMNTRILLSVLPWKKQVRYVEEKTRQNPFTGF